MNNILARPYYKQGKESWLSYVLWLIIDCHTGKIQ